MTEELLAEIKILKNQIQKYKDIEEELGIDLITLFKALKNGVYYITKTLGLRKEYVALTTEYTGSHEIVLKVKIKGTPILYFQDYGKTWAFTMEELL